MSIVTQIKNELNQLGIKPKKSMGQNFLINGGIYKKIIGALELKPGNVVIEIGPGLGTLTQYLLDTGAKVITIEKDRKLADYLKTKFINQKNVRIEEENILKYDISKLDFETSYKLIGNIPYYITSRLLRTIFENWPTPELIVLMLQKEVAQRITAKPPKMSLLAVSVQYYAEPKIISYVSRGSFYPAPKVDSALIRLQPNQTKRYPLNTKRFFDIVRAGFAGRRKQLGNNLTRELKLAKNIVEKKLKSIGIDPTRRAETLALKEWESIVTTFLPH